MKMEWVNIVAIILSPVIAVCITLWYQNTSEKKKVKRDIFMLIMKNRNSLYLSQEYIQALNSIDIIFYDDSQIREAWAEYYANLNSKNPDFSVRARLYTDLLSQIATHCGYENLKQNQIDKYYTPQGHVDELVRQHEISDELLRTLKSTEHYGAPRITHTE